jgi:hypothetical protein
MPPLRSSISTASGPLYWAASLVISIRTDRKIKRKERRCGPPGADPVTVVSEPEVYRVSFHKRRRLEDCDSVPFGYIKGELSGSDSLFVS